MWGELQSAKFDPFGSAYGTVGGAVEEATGGEFRHGFYGSFAGSVAGSVEPSLGLPKYSERSPGAVAERTSFAAAVGGTASVLGGGKFANGAVTAAFQHLFNAELAAIERAKLISFSEKQLSVGIADSNPRWRA
jgi:hypothetical protein